MKKLAFTLTFDWHIKCERDFSGVEKFEELITTYLLANANMLLFVSNKSMIWTSIILKMGYGSTQVLF